MSRLWVGRLGLAVMCAAAAAGCGKKGNPLPPLRPIPARVAEVTATRTADAVELRFVVPSQNLDQTTPVAIDRVDVYAVRTEAGQTPPPAGQVIGDAQNLIGRVLVEPPPTDAADPASEGAVRPGDVATYTHTTLETDPLGEALVYVVVPVVGSGRGRPGPPSAPVPVPLAALPAPPQDVALTYDETTLTATWESPADGAVFRLYGGDAIDGVSTLLTPATIDVATFSTSVQFGREFCVAVQAFQVTGAVSLASALSDRVCVTPDDRYPPPAPSGLRIVQEGPAVLLVWDDVDASDLAGYVVLRGDGVTTTLAPLTATPISGTTYRDSTVAPGSTYTYAVYAVDTAPAANVGPTSEHQTLTVR